jgi:multidrug efflux pump
MIPLLIAAGPGAQSRFAIGITIATGLGIGTFLTMYVLPAFYIVLAKKIDTSDNEAHGNAADETQTNTANL